MLRSVFPTIISFAKISQSVLEGTLLIDQLHGLPVAKDDFSLPKLPSSTDVNTCDNGKCFVLLFNAM